MQHAVCQRLSISFPSLIWAYRTSTYQNRAFVTVRTSASRFQPGSCHVTRQRRWDTRAITCTAMSASSVPSQDRVPDNVSTEWLESRLGDKSIKILDGTWYLPNQGKDPVAEFKANRIPGSKFFDVDGIADTSVDLPHMLPSELQFSAAADALCINNDDTVVVYDRSGLFSAPRVWWTFKVFGHDRVAVLDGGMPQWLAEDRPLDTTPYMDDDLMLVTAVVKTPPPQTKYKAKLKSNEVRSVQQVQQVIGDGSGVIVDARPPGRFLGSVPEPRPGVRGGHMPGAKNVPINQLMDNGRLKSPEAVLQEFEAAGVDLQKPVVLSCGTGVTACVLRLALQTAVPHAQVSVYDGSWTEWGSRSDTPVVTGNDA